MLGWNDMTATPSWSLNTGSLALRAAPQGLQHTVLVRPSHPIRRGTQRVEKVVVGPVGGPKLVPNKAKTLQKGGFQLLNGGQKEVRGGFQHAESFVRHANPTKLTCFTGVGCCAGCCEPSRSCGLRRR